MIFLLIPLGLANSSHEQALLQPSEPEFWVLAVLGILVCSFAGLCSGLTVGYLSIEEMQLQISQLSGTEHQKARAQAILPVIRQHHRLIATLLLSNALAMQSLPIIMHRLMPQWLAILFSSAIVVVLGQILPQALCTGPNKLQIAEMCIPLINGLMKVAYPFAGPVAYGLDLLLGKHQRKRFGRKDLRTIIKVHEDEGLAPQQVKLLKSILELREQRVQNVMVPLDSLYMLQSRQQINYELLAEIKHLRHSMIPVYDKRRSNIVGVLKTKQLANRTECFIGRRLQALKLHPFLVVYWGTNLMHALLLLQERRSTIAFVSQSVRPKKDVLGSLYMSKSDMLVKENSEAVNLRGGLFLADLFKELADDNFPDIMEDMEDCGQNPFSQENRAHLLANADSLS